MQISNKWLLSLESINMTLSYPWVTLSSWTQWECSTKYQIRTIYSSCSRLILHRNSVPQTESTASLVQQLVSVFSVIHSQELKTNMFCWNLIHQTIFLQHNMPVPNSPHIYRRIIPVEPPPESDEDFESPMSKPSTPKYTSRFDGRNYTSGVEAFLTQGNKYTNNVRKELFLNIQILAFYINVVTCKLILTIQIKFLSYASTWVWAVHCHEWLLNSGCRQVWPAAPAPDFIGAETGRGSPQCRDWWRESWRRRRKKRKRSENVGQEEASVRVRTPAQEQAATTITGV